MLRKIEKDKPNLKQFESLLLTHLVSLRNRKKELRMKGEWSMKDLEDKEDLLFVF